MNKISSYVISASRRTDIPAFYMDWFMAGMEKGYFEVENPYNRKVSRVNASKGTVHTIVFWSKNYGPFIEGQYGDKLSALGYHLFFNFTVNSENKVLEPFVPPLAARMDQVSRLAERFGPESINWRFDPICHFTGPGGQSGHNLDDFAQIAGKMAGCGLKRCITSFVDIYSKIKQRTSIPPGFSLVDPPMERKVEIINRMEALLQKHGIRLYTCCEDGVLAHLPQQSTVSASACIDNRLLMKLYGGKLSRARDRGQRTGCGCTASVDIGSYGLHPCYHNCLFCYANPSPPEGKWSMAKG